MNPAPPRMTPQNAACFAAAIKIAEAEEDDEEEEEDPPPFEDEEPEEEL